MMNNLSTLVSFNHAFMSYKDFLFNHPNNLTNESQNIKTLEILFSCLNVILNKDRITTQDENQETYIDENILEQIISIISTKKGDTYYLGNLSFNSKEEVIKTIRNKIAHGEFTIDSNSDNIIFNINQDEIKISRQALYSFTILLIERIDLYTVSPTYERTQLYASTSNLKRIKHSKDISNMLDNIYYIDYTFFDTASITPEKKAQIEELLKQIPEVISTYEREYNTKITPSFIKSFFQKHNIQVNPIIKPLSSTDYTYHLISFITENFSQIKKMDLKTQVVLISNWYQKLLNDEKPLENLTQGIHYNLFILNNLEHNKYKNLKQALENINSNNLFTSIIEIIIASELLAFYAHYQYPLENICKSKANLGEGIDYFDYSKLNLQVLRPTIFKVPEGRQSSYSEAVSATKRRLNIIDTEIKNLNTQQTNIKRLLQTAKTDTEKQKLLKALQTLEQKINKVLDQQLQELATLQEREKNLAEFNLADNTNYYYNRYLIEYIRNAIAHGNVHFYYSDSSTNLENCLIRFINKKDNQTTLDLTISIKDFDELFNIYNLSLLDEHLTNQKKGRTP